MDLWHLQHGVEVVAHAPRRYLIARAPLTALTFGFLFTTACGTSRDVTARPESPASSTTAQSAPAPASSAESLSFLHDDYARALAESKRKKVPIFVDAWAPWCHSCLSMRNYVLTDPRLAPLAKDFVWLSIDTEKESNAPFVEHFPNRVWPTLWVLDGEHESPILRWEGTATTPELITLLATVREGQGAAGAETTIAFLRASQAAARGDVAEAERGYRAVLKEKTFPERPRAIEALAGLLSGKKDYAACAELAVAENAGMPNGTSRATLLAIALDCAREGKVTSATEKLAVAAEALANDPDPLTIADDRSALFEALVETREDQGNKALAKATAQTWATFLEKEAARAPTKEARAVFDPHRLDAYLAMEAPERAVPMLEASERDFPQDYNPPARLARAYLTMKKLGDAQAAIDRATSRVYGPRSLRIFLLAADIAKARGDLVAERTALEQGVARTANSVLNENQKKARAALDQRLHTMPR